MAWLAGIVDGEGHLCYTGSPAVRVEVTSKPMVEKIYEIVGGAVRELNRKTSTGKTVYRWEVTGKNASNLCKELYSYLTTKKAQADILSVIMEYPVRSEMRKNLIELLNKKRKVLS